MPKLSFEAPPQGAYKTRLLLDDVHVDGVLSVALHFSGNAPFPACLIVLYATEENIPIVESLRTIPWVTVVLERPPA